MTQEELELAKKLAPKLPKEIEVEPGKKAVYDPDHACWVYNGKDGEKIVVKR